MCCRQRLNCRTKRLGQVPTSISLLNVPELHIFRNEFLPGTLGPLCLNADEPRPAGAGKPPAAPYGRAYLPSPILPSEMGEHQATPLRKIVATRTAVCLSPSPTGRQHSCCISLSRLRQPANQHCRPSSLAALNAGVIAKADIAVRRLDVQRLEPTQTRDPTPGNDRSLSP